MLADNLRYLMTKPFKYYGHIGKADIAIPGVIRNPDNAIIVTLDGYSIKALKDLGFKHVLSFYLDLPFDEDAFKFLTDDLKRLKEENPNIDKVIFQCYYGESRSKALAYTFSNLTKTDRFRWITNDDKITAYHDKFLEPLPHDYEFVQDRLEYLLSVTEPQ